MPTERLFPADSDAMTYLRGAREGIRTLRATAARLPLEAWLAAGCIVVVLWAVEWV